MFLLYQMQLYSFGLVFICTERPDLRDLNDRLHRIMLKTHFYSGNGVCLRQNDIQYYVLMSHCFS